MGVLQYGDVTPLTVFSFLSHSPLNRNFTIDIRTT